MALSLVKSLCPLGQPEKALGHEPQDRSMVDTVQPPRLPVSETDRASSLLTKMKLLRWNSVRPQRPQGNKTEPRASHRADRAGSQEKFLHFASRRNIFLTFPFIDQGLHQESVMSVMAIFRHYRANCWNLLNAVTTRRACSQHESCDHFTLASYCSASATRPIKRNKRA